MSIFLREVTSGTTLSWQCSHSTTNAISEVLLFSVCVCNTICIYVYPLRPRARGVCVCAVRYLSIYLRQSIYIPIHVSRMYLSTCSWPLWCQRCLCWSLSCVCVRVCVCVCVCVCVFELFCAGFESLLLDRCSRQSLIILRLFWVFDARQVFASDHSGVSLLCTWSILYTVMETLEDGIHCGRLLEEIWMVCDEDRIDYLVNFYSKSNRLSSIFTVIVIDLVAKS